MNNNNTFYLLAKQNKNLNNTALLFEILAGTGKRHKQRERQTNIEIDTETERYSIHKQRQTHRQRYR